MTYRTHVTLGLTVACSTVLIPFQELNPFFYIKSTTELAIIFALIFVSSLAPDFDEPESYLSKRFPWFIISRILSSFTKHRGVTHYFFASFIYTFIIFLIMFFILKEEVFNYLHILPFAFLAYLAHPIGDGFTKGGVPRFWYPISKKTFWFLPKFLRFYTGGFVENIYFLLITSLFLLEIYYILSINLPILNFLDKFFL